MEVLVEGKAFRFSNFLVESDYAIAISWETKKERRPWKFDKWLRQIIAISLELGCFFSWAPCLSNHTAYALAKREARHMTFFIGDLTPM